MRRVIRRTSPTSPHSPQRLQALRRISCSPRIFSDLGTLSRSFPAAQPSQLRSKVHDRHQECSLKPHPQAIPQPPAAGFPVHRLRFYRIYSNSRMAFSRCFAGTPLRFSGIECGKHFRAGLPSRVSRPQAIRKAPLRSAPNKARPGTPSRISSRSASICIPHFRASSIRFMHMTTFSVISII